MIDWTVTARKSLPLSLEDVKSHLRLLPNDTSEDEGILTPLIGTALEYCEDETGVAYCVETISVRVDGQKVVELPRVPVVSITSVTSGGEDVEGWSVDSFGVLTLPEATGPVQIVYTAGGDAVPLVVRQAMLMLIAHWYENREAVAIGSIASVQPKLGVSEMLRHQRRWWF